jgi:hypothetical protein
MEYQIPKRIIQTGKSVEQPLRNRAMMQNIRLLNPDFEYLFFDDAAVSRFISQEFPEYRKIFDTFPYRVQKFDFFRYLAIYRYGGFYFDLDIMLAKSVADLLHSGCVFPFEGLTFSRFLREQHQIDWEIGNYAFGASPGHPFLNCVIQNCVRAHTDREWLKLALRGLPVLSKSDFLVLNSTGPGLITRTMVEDRSLAALINVLFPDDVCDVSTWNRFGDYGIHLMEGSWRERGGFLRSRLTQKCENWKLRGLMKESRKLGKSRTVYGTQSRIGSHNYQS